MHHCRFLRGLARVCLLVNCLLGCPTRASPAPPASIQSLAELSSNIWLPDQTGEVLRGVSRSGPFAGQEDCPEESGCGQRRWTQTHRGPRSSSLLLLPRWEALGCRGAHAGVGRVLSPHWGGQPPSPHSVSFVLTRSCGPCLDCSSHPRLTWGGGREALPRLDSPVAEAGDATPDPRQPRVPSTGPAHRAARPREGAVPGTCSA